MNKQTWTKSSYSGASGGNCIETRDDGSRVLVRDTKQNGTGPVLRISPDAWRRFTGRVKDASLSSSEVL